MAKATTPPAESRIEDHRSTESALNEAFISEISMAEEYLPDQLPARPLQDIFNPQEADVEEYPAEDFLPEQSVKTFKQPLSPGKPQIAIIIDDIGYNRQQGMAALSLPGDYTYAMLPFTPNVATLAAEAHRQQKEIMLHSPMSTVGNHHLGEGALTHTMDRATVQRILKESLDSLPNIQGVNNHQGSLLTQNGEAMTWVMEVLRERQLYFIDSRTTNKSVAFETASAFEIPTRSRDVFLDHERDPRFIEKQFNYLIRLAKRKGYAVAIGHPYPETLAFLSTKSGTFDELGVDLVPASKIVEKSDRLK